jgi:hypothetical protein
MEDLLLELKKCRDLLSHLRPGGFPVQARLQRAYMWQNRIVEDMTRKFLASKWYLKAEDVEFKQYALDGVYTDVFAVSVDTKDLELYFTPQGELQNVTLGMFCEEEKRMDI